MKPAPLLLLVFMLCILQSNAQEFQKRYSSNDYSILYNSITALQDSGIAIVNLGFGIPISVIILKLDKYGTVQKEKTFNVKNFNGAETTMSQTPGIVEGDDKSITIAYNSANWTDTAKGGLKILHLDSNLNLLWSKLLPSSNFVQYNNLVSIGNKYYCINNNTDKKITNNVSTYRDGLALCGLNSDGSTIFSNKIFGEYTEFPPWQHLTKNNLNNLVVCSQIGPLYAAEKYYYLRGSIIELDTLGNIKRALNIKNTFLTSIEQDEHDNYILAGQVVINDTPRYFISLLDVNFSPIWAKALPDLFAGDKVSTLIDNNEIYVFTKHNSLSGLNTAITKLDYAGNAIASYYSGNNTSIYYGITKSKNGNFVIGDMTNMLPGSGYIFRSTQSINSSVICPYLTVCAPPLRNLNLETAPLALTVEPHYMKDIVIEERPTNTVSEDYCIPVGVLDASFTLAKDTFCSGEAFDLRSNPQLLSGESVWQITGPDNFTYVAKDTLGVKLDKAGSYTILHLHRVAFCTDTFSRSITVLGAPSTISITTCDTIRAAQISNCPFNWPDGSSDSIYIATSNSTWNISTQCAVCTSNVAVQLTVTPKPYLLEKAADICEGKTLPYTLIGQHINDALWADGSTGTSYTFDSAGTYALMLYNNGCMQADTLSVNMIDCRTCDIYLPNAFTPNGDGYNDAFGAYTNCTQIIQFSLQVYNRWGEKVYESNDLNAAWDGTYKGQAAPLDTYVYYVSISYNTATDAETKKYKGSVVLIR